MLLQENRAVLDALHQFRKLGVRICMDDFGTGYSSLTSAAVFPFDKIKIDRSFMRELGRGRTASVIIRAVMRLGSSLGMITTAESVETEEELDILRSEGCLQAQGYLFSRPKPASEIPAMLQLNPPALTARRSSGRRLAAAFGVSGENGVADQSAERCQAERRALYP